MPLPPLPEQQRIAAYLDASCAAIDAAVAAKRRQLETLEAVRDELINRGSYAGNASQRAEAASDEDWITEIPSALGQCAESNESSPVLHYGISESTEPERTIPSLQDEAHHPVAVKSSFGADFVDEFHTISCWRRAIDLQPYEQPRPSRCKCGNFPSAL